MVANPTKVFSTIRTVDVQALSKFLRRRVVEPKFMDRYPEANIIAKLGALIVLPVLIIVSLTLTVTYHVLMSGILIAIGPDVFMEFFATLTTLIFYCIMTYAWFQWVRTGGFGLLRF